MQQIDPAIQQLIENGRQAVELQEAKRRQKAQAEAEKERQEWEAAWVELETAVAEQLPEAIKPYAAVARKAFPMKPDNYTGIRINIPTLAPIIAYFRKHTNVQLVKYHTFIHDLLGRAQDAIGFNNLELCLVHAAKMAELASRRTIFVREYQTVVNRWREAHDAATAVNEALTHTLQRQICDHYGDSFALWQVHYAYFDDEVVEGTAVVLENEPIPLGYWRVVRGWDGEVKLMAYTNVFAVESLGDYAVRKSEYTIRLYDEDDSGLGIIYLPPYLTADEVKTAEALRAETAAKAQSIPEQPHPRTFEGAELFEEWELDYLYNNTQGGDADI